MLAFRAARLLAVAYRALLVQVLAFLGLVLLLLASLAAALAIEASLALSLSVARRMTWLPQALVLTEPLLSSTVPQRKVGPTWAKAPEGWGRGLLTSPHWPQSQVPQWTSVWRLCLAGPHATRADLRRTSPKL